MSGIRRLYEDGKLGAPSVSTVPSPITSQAVQPKSIRQLVAEDRMKERQAAERARLGAIEKKKEDALAYQKWERDRDALSRYNCYRRNADAIPAYHKPVSLEQWKAFGEAVKAELETKTAEVAEYVFRTTKPAAYYDWFIANGGTLEEYQALVIQDEMRELKTA